MRVEELAFVCEEAARDLLAREERPLPPAIVLPDPQATRVVTLPDFPDEDQARAAVLHAFAEAEILERSQPAYGFVAEAEVDGDDVIVVVYGAHGTPAQVTAAPISEAGLGDFVDPGPLDPAALPFLHPLQEAVERVTAPPEPPGIPGFGTN
ncbi:MAG: hypothetical protein ACRDUY_05840 [Nitriliruptorales bacterium]